MRWPLRRRRSARGRLRRRDSPRDSGLRIKVDREVDCYDSGSTTSCSTAAFALAPRVAAAGLVRLVLTHVYCLVLLPPFGGRICLRPGLRRACGVRDEGSRRLLSHHDDEIPHPTPARRAQGPTRISHVEVAERRLDEPLFVFGFSDVGSAPVLAASSNAALTCERTSALLA